MSNEAKDYESIWCPKCRYQFRQISDSDDQHIRELEAENERLLKVVATRLLDDIDERIGEKDAEE